MVKVTSCAVVRFELPSKAIPAIADAAKNLVMMITPMLS